MTNLLASALALGLTYALVGVAVSLVAVAVRTLHLAVGQVLVAGVLVALVAGSDVIGLPMALIVPGALALGALVSASLEPLVLGRLPGGLTWLVGLAVAAATIEAVVARTVTATSFRPDPLLDLTLPAGVSPAVLSAATIGLPVVLLLALALRHTRWGMRARLVGGSTAAAERAGISPGRVRAQVLAVAGATSVLAGLLAAPVAFVSTGQAAGFTIRGVAAAALVGNGGPASAVVGGLLLGGVEVAGARLWPAAGGEVTVAATVVVVLAVRGGAHLRAWGRTW